MAGRLISKDYLSFLLRAKTRHGTHSPFIYQMVDQVIYDRSVPACASNIEGSRHTLLQDDRRIDIADQDDRSASLAGKLEKVKHIARYTLLQPRYAQLLYRIASCYGPGNLLEIGSSLGITTAYLASSRPENTVYTIEECRPLSATAAEVLRDNQCGNVALITGNFENTLPELSEDPGKFGFVYISGRYSPDTTLRYFELLLPFVTEDAVVVIEKMYRNNDMKAVWSAIQQHAQVTVTVDLFRIGLIFFKKGQAKEHFSIRF